MSSPSCESNPYPAKSRRPPRKGGDHANEPVRRHLHLAGKEALADRDGDHRWIGALVDDAHANATADHPGMDNARAVASGGHESWRIVQQAPRERGACERTKASMSSRSGSSRPAVFSRSKYAYASSTCPSR